MKTNFVSAFLGLVLAVNLVFTSFCGEILSGSFEEDPNTLWYPPDFNAPWDANGYAPEIFQTFTVYDRDRNPVTIEPIDSQYFVVLKTGGGSEENNYSRLTQIIDINAGETITGSYFFATTDWMPNWNDTATIMLIPADPCSGLTEILLAYKDVNSVVYYGGQPGGSMSEWGRFSYTFDSNEGGAYILELLVEDAIDFAYASYLAVDALKITAGPPEPWCNYNLAGDINNDCRVDFLDFALMLENWLVDCMVMPDDPSCVPK